MAAQIGDPPRSRRFIKLYLFTWALLATGALAYLALLAFPPLASAPAPHAAAEPVKAAPGDSKTLAEVRSMRGSLSEIRKDVTQLQDSVGERVANEKVVDTRLTALEERVGEGQQQPASEPPAKEPPTKVPGLVTVPGVITVPTIKIQGKNALNTGPQPGAEGPADMQKGPASAPVTVAPPIETGSIDPKEPTSIGAKPEIVFGEAIVTPANQPEFAVQLAAGPSLQALKQSWGQLTERHPGALASLQPRVIAPRSEGGLYRLLAGPVRTKADAERICSALGVGPKACFATPYAGSPL